MPQGLNPVHDFIPVARLADMLLSPGERFEFNGCSYGYPEIKLVYWAGGNPFHHQQDLNKLARAWRRPETVIVHEPWWNALAKQADIVMPCTTSLERNDLGIARDEGHLFAMHQAVEPIGSARSDFAILTDIAVLLGFADAFTDRMDEMGWVRDLYGLARQRAAAHGLDLPIFETFWQKGEVRLPPPEDEILLARFRADPDGNRLDTPSGKIELVSDRISGFGYSDCPGHPVWLEPTEWLGMSASAEFPLHLVSNQPATRLHSQYDHGNVSQASKVAGCEPIRMHPHDAASRDIQGGQVVLVSSPRGQCLAGAVLDDDVSPSCVQLSTGAWFDPVDIGRFLPLDRQGNPNVLTVDRGTSRLAQGPTAHTTMVQIVGWSEPLPAVGPFTPPQIDHR